MGDLFFYAIGNSVGIPYCIKKPYRAGLHCGGKVDVAEATRRRRRILQAGFLFTGMVSPLPGKLRSGYLVMSKQRSGI